MKTCGLSSAYLPSRRTFDRRLKTILKESNNEGWNTKQVEEIIIKESGIRYHHNYIYYIKVRKWGFKQKVPRKVHVNTASTEEKEEFKKRPARYLWMLEAKKEKEKEKERLCHSFTG